MKLVKLSLVAALAAGAFSVANATPVEEAIKDIDVSGVLRYRYDTGRFGKDLDIKTDSALNKSKQEHKYRAQVNFNAAIADNFKAFIQFDYNSQDGGYTPDPKNPNAGSNLSNTSDTFAVRQLYLTYTNEDVATSVIAGKQQLNTIWTDNGIDGLVGTGVKVVNNSIDGLTLAAFAVDSSNAQNNTDNKKGDPDASEFLDFTKNIYGVAAVGSYDVMGGQFNPQLWLAYMSDTAFLYALDLAYTTTIFDGVNWTIEGAYLGNSLDSNFKDAHKISIPGSTSIDTVADSNFFALRGSIEVNGWDASLGGLYYGDKEKISLVTIEDQGNLGSLLAGEEIFYTNGSQLNGSIGRNIFGYITAGYTFNETVRVGADFVYGGTKTDAKVIGHFGGGDKLEAVARVDYKYSPKLDFSAFYSYVNVDNGGTKGEGDHSTVRLQALYKF